MELVQQKSKRDKNQADPQHPLVPVFRGEDLGKSVKAGLGHQGGNDVRNRLIHFKTSLSSVVRNKSKI